MPATPIDKLDARRQREWIDVVAPGGVVRGAMQTRRNAISTKQALGWMKPGAFLVEGASRHAGIDP